MNELLRIAVHLFSLINSTGRYDNQIIYVPNVDASGAQSKKLLQGRPETALRVFMRLGEEWSEGRSQDDDITFAALRIK